MRKRITTPLFLMFVVFLVYAMINYRESLWNSDGHMMKKQASAARAAAVEIFVNSINEAATETPATTAGPERLYPEWVLKDTVQRPRLKIFNYDPHSSWTVLNGRKPRASVWPKPQRQSLNKAQVMCCVIFYEIFMFPLLIVRHNPVSDNATDL